MRHAYLILFIAVALLSSGLYAQDRAAVEVQKIAICTSIENKQPVGMDSVFAANVGKLYCYTKIKSQADTTEITHVWLFEGKEMTKVVLPIKAKSWRTWSAKTILPEWKGDWRVEVQDSAGDVLTSISFKLQ
jgi:hypothetical protein